jgi:F0F1-type ATP synthase assembly protein I
MSKAAGNQTTKSTTSTPKPDQKLSIGRELLDTTWRMTVPVVLFAGLGIAADRVFDSKPWATLLGTLIGFGFASLLVKRQINRLPVTPLSPQALKNIKKRNEAYDNEKDDYYSDGDAK